MIKKFDFSKAEKGKFYTTMDDQIPIYLDNDVKKYFLNNVSAYGQKIKALLYIGSIKNTWNCF